MEVVIGEGDDNLVCPNIIREWGRRIAGIHPIYCICRFA